MLAPDEEEDALIRASSPRMGPNGARGFGLERAASRGDGRSAWRSCGAKGTGIAPELRRAADEPSERRVAAVGAFFEEKKLSAASGTFTVDAGIA